MPFSFFSMSGGELFERITSDDYQMSEAEAIGYMRQICEAIKHMHEKNIIHLDIKVMAAFVLIPFVIPVPSFICCNDGFLMISA